MSTITITTGHSASSYGVPVCLVNGKLQDDVNGLRACLEVLGWRQSDLAKHSGKTTKTIQSYLYQDRPVPAEVWLVIKDALKKSGPAE